MSRPIIEKLKDRLAQRWPQHVNAYKSLRAFRAKVIRIDGTVRGSNHPLSLLYVGNGTNLPYLRDAMFSGCDIREVARCNIWNANKAIKRHEDDAELVIVDLPWPYSIDFPPEEPALEMPAWIRQEIHFAPTFEETISRLHKSARKEELRKIRKHKLTCASTRDPEAINYFYDEMYLPHTRKRFGDSAPVSSREWVMHCARFGKLLQILRDGEFVAGSVMCDTGYRLAALFNGFVQRDWKELPGVSGALYYFLMLDGFGVGYKQVDVGGSRAFLNDGVYRIKKRWGAEVHDDWSLETLVLKPNRLGPGVLDFLARNPPLTRVGDQLVAKVLFNEVRATGAMVKQALRDLVSPGVDALNIYTTVGAAHDAFEAAAESATPVKIVDLREKSDPVAAYAYT